MNVIVNGKIILKDGILENHVLVYDEKIVDIKKQDEFDYSKFEKIIDASNNYVSPGFIDLHIHGSNGFDTMDGTIDIVKSIAKSIIKTGVTSFLPTTMTMSKEEIIKALENIKECMKLNLKGAKIQGVHLEGPFINKKYKGAQNEKYIIKPDFEFIKPYLDVLKIITFAPEKDENNEFINAMKNYKNVRLSIGHTNATFEQAIEAMDNGVTYVTHTFNAMTPLHHRNPGVIGAVFSRDVDCELIADTIHVHKGFFQAFIDINKKEKIILITDCIRAGCLKCGEYQLGGQKIIVDEKSSKLENGALAGSILKLNEAIRNVKANTNYKLNEVINMASLNPARAIKIDEKYGTIEKNKVADLVIFDDDINILKTIIDGKIVYEVN